MANGIETGGSGSISGGMQAGSAPTTSMTTEIGTTTAQEQINTPGSETRLDAQGAFSQMPQYESGPKPANDILSIVKRGGIDEGFQRLATGSIGKGSAEEVHNRSNKSPGEQASVAKPKQEKPKEDKKAPQKPDRTEEDVIELLRRKIKELQEANRLLAEKLGATQEELKATSEQASVANVRTTQQLKALQEQMRENDATEEVVIVDLTKRMGTLERAA